MLLRPEPEGVREIGSILVVTPVETCLHVASTLGHKFSIIVGRRKWIPKREGNVWLYGLEKKLASFREVGFSVRRMMKEPEKLKEAIVEQAEKAIKEDGAEVIILGCTAESGFMRELTRRLGVPVLDPVVITWKYAGMLADLYRKLA